MRLKDIRTFQDLVTFLENYTSWDEGHAYDTGAILILIKALLKNLQVNALDADLRGINGYLEADDKECLNKLNEYARLPEED